MRILKLLFGKSFFKKTTKKKPKKKPIHDSERKSTHILGSGRNIIELRDHRGWIRLEVKCVSR